MSNKCTCDVCQQTRRLNAIISYYKMSKGDAQFLRDLWEQMASAETDLAVERINREENCD